MSQCLTNDKSSPRLVIYQSEGCIIESRVVADKSVRVRIPNPTTSKSLAALLACYYAWHTIYPPAYNRTLLYLENVVLGLSPEKFKQIDKFVFDIKQANKHVEQSKT